MTDFDTIRPVHWADDHLALLDQRLLPGETRWLRCDSADAVADAIRAMVVRGAPAIGIAAAFGAVLAAREAVAAAPTDWRGHLRVALERLEGARPTAVNLRWALQRQSARLEGDPPDPASVLLAEAEAIATEDLAANRRMGELGAALITKPGGVLTHCNTGSLATAGYGTALGVIRSGWAAGCITRVFADETRPWLQGARLTAWELLQDGIPVELLADGAAPALLRTGAVSWVIVGADRVTANGDVANKIGTYALAIAARHHDVGFMVVAPRSTVDMATPDGDAITIETRDADELLSLGGQRVAAPGAGAWNPVFDVTPAALVDALVTEQGVVHSPDAGRMATAFGGDAPRAMPDAP
ncbi:S-methyl-5-thioribose-1-phosphate isomerase [Aquisalimonas sp. 2447]|uniref:S-methyl-5-thioribose-1-phosphate isomerase n=1 Tax=Aquisalimonas sp. 2447 TaxID=2740807 RepID=UPI0014324710|nr:S-methyl-5-thioribose-1-phosphate isomerase [Aquisalimonas sp. 2447]QIT54624.1 S-methyl-5-thioribose-1-phosphate isomerase [Aquisalimonas sp. 2447]